MTPDSTVLAEADSLKHFFNIFGIGATYTTMNIIVAVIILILLGLYKVWRRYAHRARVEDQNDDERTPLLPNDVFDGSSARAVRGNSSDESPLSEESGASDGSHSVEENGAHNGNFSACWSR
jgi:hypothetical protein